MVEVEVGGLVLGRRVAFSCTVYEINNGGYPWRWEVRPADGLTWEQVFGPDWSKIVCTEKPTLSDTCRTEKEARSAVERKVEFLVRTALGENRFRWVVTAEPGLTVLDPEPEPVNKKLRRRG